MRAVELGGWMRERESWEGERVGSTCSGRRGPDKYLRGCRSAAWDLTGSRGMVWPTKSAKALARAIGWE